MKYTILLLFFIVSGVSVGAQDPVSTDSSRVFTSLAEALEHPSQVFRLNLTRQKLKSFPAEILQLSELRELTLSKNKIQHLPNEISTLRHLESLICIRCELDTIPPGVFDLRNLKTLDLGDNYITTLPESIEQLQSLENLVLWDNPIRSYPNAFGQLPRLKYLDFLHNMMSRDTQERIRQQIPNVRIVFPAPCHCEDGY